MSAQRFKPYAEMSAAELVKFHDNSKARFDPFVLALINKLRELMRLARQKR